MLKMRAKGELPAHELAIVMVTKMVAKGWVECVGSKEVLRITAAGEAALKAELPMSKGNKPVIA